MNATEWALIVFTILMQLAVGALLVLQVLRTVIVRQNGEAANRLPDLALFALVPIVGVALLASLFHLANPIGAPRALANIGTSWLSREILLSVLFGLLVVTVAFLHWRAVGSPALRNALSWIAAVIGLLLVYSMSRIYMLAAQPAWNSLATPLSFFATTLLLGTLGVGAFAIATRRLILGRDSSSPDGSGELMRGVLRIFAVASIVLLGIELVVLPVYIASLATGSAAGIASVRQLTGVYGWLLALRLVCVVIGVGVLGGFLHQSATTSGRERTLAYLAYGAFGLILLAEVLGRFLFYASNYNIGV